MTSSPYAHLHEMSGSHRAAERVVPRILEVTGPVRSVVDLGGGDGGWLEVFRGMGVEEVQLVDSPDVEPHLRIGRDRFVPADLNWEFPPPRRFDLAVCLECAEHLAPDRAEPLVDWLSASSDLVVFSAAIPGQGGAGHVNERPPEYWRDLFRQRGLERHDVLRGGMLRDPAIPWWYAQNVFVFARPTVRLRSAEGDFLPEDFHLVHRRISWDLDPRHLGLRKLAGLLGPALLATLRRRLGG